MSWKPGQSSTLNSRTSRKKSKRSVSCKRRPQSRARADGAAGDEEEKKGAELGADLGAELGEVSRKGSVRESKKNKRRKQNSNSSVTSGRFNDSFNLELFIMILLTNYI